MKLVVRGCKVEEPVELWLELMGDDVYVRARKGSGPNWNLVKFTERGICCLKNVDRNLGFPVEAVSGNIMVAE